MKRVFISYAHDDIAFRDALVSHLQVLCVAGIIANWHDGEIAPGEDWKAAIDRELHAADIIVLLVSASFLASKSCQQLELAPALRRWNEKGVLIIPVIVRSCDWDASPLGRLQVLPKQAKPVATWLHQDDAWTDVTRKIRAAATTVRGESATAPARNKAPPPDRRPTPLHPGAPATSTPLLSGFASETHGPGILLRRALLLHKPSRAAGWMLHVTFYLLVAITTPSFFVGLAVVVYAQSGLILLWFIGAASILCLLIVAVRACAVRVNSTAQGRRVAATTATLPTSARFPEHSPVVDQTSPLPEAVSDPSHPRARASRSDVNEDPSQKIAWALRQGWARDKIVDHVFHVHHMPRNEAEAAVDRMRKSLQTESNR